MPLFCAYNEEQQRVLQTINKNRSNPWFGLADDDDTIDKIFVLSLFDIISYYGDSGLLNENPNSEIYWINDQYNNNRIALNADNDASWWWLRTPGICKFNSIAVSPNGWISMDGHNVDNYGNGIRPAMWIGIEEKNL